MSSIQPGHIYVGASLFCSLDHELLKLHWNGTVLLAHQVATWDGPPAGTWSVSF